MLARLVAFNTTSGNSNLPLADFLADYLDRPNVRIRRNPSADTSKANLIVEIGPAGNGSRAGLVLSGHMDVVPAGEPEWESDPFTLTARDGKLFGRGACDMKGFLAIATNLAHSCDPGALRAPLVLLFTYDEELGLLGAKRFAETWGDVATLPRSTVVGEPTRLEVVRAHKGFGNVRITVRGVSAHSGYPHLGKSAIEPAGRVIGALAALRQELEQERPAHADDFPDVPFVSLNVGRVVGGTATNVIPDVCVIELSARPLPHMTWTEVLRRVHGAVVGVAESDSVAVEEMTSNPGLLLDRKAPIYRALMEATGQARDRSVCYATDAGWLQEAGFDCAVYGPGDIAVAHKPNEFVPVDELDAAREVVERLITRFCR